MDLLTVLSGACVVLIIGLGTCVAFLCRSLIAHARTQSQNMMLQQELLSTKQAHAERQAQWEDTEGKLSTTFKALSFDALRDNTDSFMKLISESLRQQQEVTRADTQSHAQNLQHLVQPLHQALEKVDQKIQHLETARQGAYSGLLQQVQSLSETHQSLRTETANLANALRSPVSRGRWGEVQLKRVVELAGMLAHCDFYEQQSMQSADGVKRPDVVVNLPGGKKIIIDAKAPLHAYLEALDCTNDEQRRAKLKQHAQAVRRHIQALSQKAYWDEVQPSPEFVVLFIPGESFYSAALEQDPSLIEVGADHRVIIATPTTLIALLRAVHYGWRQEAVAENAREVSDLGRELYQRVADMAQHLGDLGSSLGQAVDRYNKSVGTFEARVMVTARRFKDLKVDDPKKEIRLLEEIDTIPRTLREVGDLRL